jgi:hypothetical protein
MARPRKEFNFDGEINRETVKNYFESQNERLGKYRGKRKSMLLDQLVKEAKDKRIKKLICGARKSNGKICTKEPHYKEDGTTNGRCLEHGGASTGAKTEEGKVKSLSKLDPYANLVHGLYAKDTYTVEEVNLVQNLYEKYKDQLELEENPINYMLFDRALRNFILQIRKENQMMNIGEVEESQSYNDFDSKFLRFIQALGLDRKFLLSKEHKDNGGSLDDIAMLFVDTGSGVKPEKKQVIEAEYEDIEEEENK